MKKILTFMLIFIIAGSCGAKEKGRRGVMQKNDTGIRLTSDGFENNGLMPDKYAYRNKNLSPRLHWENVPGKTKSFVIICDDPDAPVGTWVHWVIFNIPAGDTHIPEGVEKKKILDNGAVQGTNDFGKIGYDGPAPPSGVHRYYFKIYALDTMLNLKPGVTKENVIEASKGHILGYGELIGKYAHK